MIEFFVRGEPRPQPRPRAFARKIGNKFVARVYDAGTAEGWKGQVALAAKDHLPGSPIEGPVYLELKFYFPRPQAHFIKAGLRANAPVFHTSRGDFDNCAKSVTDAMTTLRFWNDDSQLCNVTVTKLYAGNEGPGCIVRVSEL